MKIKDAPEKIKPFIFHGVMVDVGETQSQATCPFCDKDDHFGIETKTGRWRCVRCSESGNIATFIKRLYEAGLDQLASREDDLKALAKDRGVRVSTLKRWGIADAITQSDDFLLPSYNAQGKLSNLYRVFRNDEGELKCWSTPGLKLHPFGVNLLPKKFETLWVTEGPWDGMAWWELLHTHRSKGTTLTPTKDQKRRLTNTDAVISVPGSSSFDPAWFEYFKHADTVRLMYDNDYPRRLATGKRFKPGWDGMQRVVKLLADYPNRSPELLQLLQWGTNGYDKKLPDGYDIRDCLHDRGRKSYSYIRDRLQTVKMEEAKEAAKRSAIEPIHRDSFEGLCTDYRTKLHFTQQMKDTLAVMLAVVASTDLNGDPLWMRIIGPPGSGKSTLAEAISASDDYTYPTSIQTGFHSGYTAGVKRGGDASLIPKMDRKTLIMKDGDTLLTSPSRDRILAELRDIYDGTTRARYRTGQSKVYEDIRVTFLLCGTDTLRALNRSSLGERFLDCEILGDADQTPILDRSATNAYEIITSSFVPKSDEDNDNVRSDAMKFLKQVTVGYINHFKTVLSQGEAAIPSISDDTTKRIKAIGEFLGYMRAKVERDNDGLLFRPRVELATRLISQFMRLAICLAVVQGKDSIDREIIRVCRKVATDSAEGFQFEATSLLYKHRKTGLSAKQIEHHLCIGEGTVRRLLNNMLELKIVERDERKPPSGVRGRTRHMFRLTTKLQNLYKVALGKK